MQLIRRIPRPASRAWMALLALGTATLAHAQAVPKAVYEDQGSFQLPEKGQPGASERPAALGFGPDRTLHIADKGLILVYDSAGAYQRNYGAEILDRPIALALVLAGESYVLDEGRKQVFVFGPSGTLLRRIAESGSRAGQLDRPIDFTVGPAGYLYVLDGGRKGVEIFSRDGLFVRHIGLGTIEDPAALAVGNNGWIFISDRRSADIIYALPPFTELPWSESLPRGVIRQIQFRGANFSEPIALAVNDLGTLAVLDRKSGRVYSKNAFSSEEIGTDDLLYGGSGDARGSFREAADLTFVGPDRLLILDGRLRQVERIRLATLERLEAQADFRFSLRVSTVPRSLSLPLLDVGYGPDGAPRFLLEDDRRAISLTGTQVEMYRTVYGDSASIFLPDPTHLQRRFSQDIGEVAAAAVTDSLVLIADSRRDRFAVFARESGALLGTYGDRYDDERRLRRPQGLAVLPDGRIVIADTGNDKIKIFSADLASLLGDYRVARPVGVAVSPDGKIFVWNEDGTTVGELRIAEERLEPLKPDLLTGPVAALTFDDAGNLFALDRQTHRITVIETGLERVMIQLGAEGVLERPGPINVDRSGNIYLSDPGAGRTLIYRWDVSFPPIAAIQLAYEAGAAVLRWSAGPEGFVHSYVIEGASASGGPYRPLATTSEPPFRLDSTNISEPVPRYVRVAPRYITGVKGEPTEALPLGYFAAVREYERGEYAEAMRDASEIVRLIEGRLIDSDDAARSTLLYIGFASAYELRDYTLALDWAQQTAAIPMPSERIIPFLFRLAEVYLQLGYPSEASQQILRLVGQGPRPEYYQDEAVVDQSFRIYRTLRDAGSPEIALEYMRLYAESMPSSVAVLRDVYEDSITVFATRGRVGPGVRYWRDAAYGQVVTFFEDELAQGGLTREEEVIARQLLAAAYYAFGRREEAEDTFRAIFTVSPGFDLSREIPRLQRLYGVTIYNPETERFFGNLRPGS
ncbi:MAG: NHL repeat-containing protein [Gemmatimonadota bacterium]|nr:MAG: NHL repeat-containing protein [Gemmatimonadota bacterium]